MQRKKKWKQKFTQNFQRKKSEKKKLLSTLFLKSKVPYKKKKIKKINHSTVHNLNIITILNIYNPLNNIKFTKKKVKKKNLPNTLFLESKVPYKKKKKKKKKR